MLWLIFGVAVVAMLAADLGVFHRRAHTIHFREALAWSLAWFTLAFLFMWVVYFWRGPEHALAFLAGYLIEWSLSADNIFVFLVIFSYFRVPSEYQHKVLFWGIVGAVIMRAIMITAGVALIHQFHWIVYLFGGFLIVTGVHMAFQREGDIHPERNPVLKLVRRLLPVTKRYHDGRFLILRRGVRAVTPLFVVLTVVESTDVVFAVDSVPAVLAISTDPFIVYTSNVFAILGLRSLYFLVSGLLQLFQYLKYGLAVILVFVGAKMILSDVLEIPVAVALGVVATILLLSIVISLIAAPERQLPWAWPREREPKGPDAGRHPRGPAIG